MMTVSEYKGNNGNMVKFGSQYTMDEGSYDDLKEKLRMNKEGYFMSMIGDAKPSRQYPKNWTRTDCDGLVKPRTHYYHYSNPASQGAIICETLDYPDAFNPEDFECVSAYSDRMHSWDAERFEKACQLAGGGEQGWAYSLPKLSHEDLKEFARVALNLKREPTHVRIVHWFNVSNGYSCPTVQALVSKVPIDVPDIDLGSLSAADLKQLEKLESELRPTGEKDSKVLS